MGSVTQPIFEWDNSKFIGKSHNITVILGNAPLKDNRIIDEFATVHSSLEFNFIPEINEKNIMKLKVIKFELSNMKLIEKEKEKDLTIIEGIFNGMSSMFYDGLSKKGLFGNGIMI